MAGQVTQSQKEHIQEIEFDPEHCKHITTNIRKINLKVIFKNISEFLPFNVLIYMCWKENFNEVI